jgi:cytochrome c oxidase cbb3-type subunit III
MRRWPLIVLVAASCDAERKHHDRVVLPEVGEQVPVHTSTLFAGPRVATPQITNPYDGNVLAIREGERFYQWFNCGGCHGAIGGGAIGPPLRDRDWIYGGSPLQIYRSIVEGRPQGMPAYRGIPDEALWKIIAYVTSLGGRHELAIADPEEAARAPQDEERHAD